MKQLLVFTAIVSAISSLPLVEDYHGSYWSSNRFKGVLQEAYNSSGSIHQRFIRADVDNLKAPLERLQRIARITNGIHLLNELIAGTIPADELISELLFFGSVTPSEITILDEKRIEAAIESLKSLPNNLDASTEVVNAENSFDKLSELLNKIEGIGNLEEWKEGKQHFKDEIGRLERDGLDTTTVHTLSSSVSNWRVNYNKIENNGANADSNTFDEVKKELNKLKGVISGINNLGMHWEFNQFDTLMNGLSPITKAADGVKFVIDNYVNLQTTKDRGNAYSSFLNETSFKISLINGVNPPLQAIRNLIVSKEFKNRQRALKHTHGLPRGLMDVKEATYDVGDPWIKKIVTTDALKVAFKKLEELETLLSKSDNSLDFNKQGVTSIDGLLKHVASVSDIFANIENVQTGITQTYACQSPQPLSVDSAKFNKLKEKLTGIDEKLEQLEEEKEKLSSQLNKKGLVEMCGEVIQICDEAQNAANIQESVKNFKSYGKLRDLDNILQDIDKIVGKIKDVSPDRLKADATAVIAELDALDNYHTSLNHYSEYFNCLQSQDKLKLVFKMADGIKKIRQFKSDKTYIPSLDKGLEVVKKVTSVKKDLENSKSELDKFKEFNSSETKELTVFKKSGELSKVIGEAVQGVDNMKNALEKKTKTVDKVLDNIQFVENNQKLLTDPTDMKNLQDLIGLKSSIQSMYSTLDTFIGGVKDNDSPILKNHSDLFESAKSVSGVSGNFLAMISSLENLKMKIPGSNELEELETSLKTMETMGLDFTKYQTSFDNSGSSLGDLDVAFANYNKRMARKAPPPPSQQQQGASSGSQGSDNKKDKKKDDNTTKIGLIAILTVLVLGVSSVPVYIFVWRPWKSKRNMRKFLDKLMEDLYLRYENMKKGKMTDKEVVNLLFSNAYNDDTSSNKDKVINLTSRCKEEECDIMARMAKRSAMVLKGYGDLFKSAHFHAMVVPVSRRKKVILSHIPTEVSPDTPEKVARFYWMAKQYRSETIVWVDPFGRQTKNEKPLKNIPTTTKQVDPAAQVKEQEKPDKKIPTTTKQDDPAAQAEEVDANGEEEDFEHIPEEKGGILKFESVTVTCLEMEVISDKKKYPELKGLIEKRKLKIEIKNQKPFTINHILCPGWAEMEDKDLEDTFDYVYLLNMIENDKTPPIIASMRMIKSEVLVFVLFARSLIRKNSGLTLKTIMQRYSEYNYTSFPFHRPYKAGILMLYELLTQDGKVKVKDVTKKRYEMFKKSLIITCTTNTEDPSKTEDSAKTGDQSKTGDFAKSEVASKTGGFSKSEVPSKNEAAPKK